VANMDDERTRSGNIGLVLGAGGGAGGQWIGGVLGGLRDTIGFLPEHASTLIGTSIGAIRAAGIGPHRPPSTAVVEALLAAGGPIPRQSLGGQALAGLRSVGGKVAAIASRAGEPDPLTWVEQYHPETRAQVCSMQRLPPRRRVASIADAADPVREIAASAAVPFGAQRVTIEGAGHIDGAVWSVTNADLADPGQLDVLVVIAPLVTTDGGTLVSALGRHQLAAELRPWHRSGKPALVFAPNADQYERRQERAEHHADARALAIAITSSKD